MKNILNHIALLLLVFTSSKIIAQTPVTIVKGTLNSPYNVTSNETLVATESISLLPNTWIKSGSTFIASVNPNAYIPATFSDENYVLTRSFQKPMTTTAGISNNGDVIESITYFDGLGRPMQNISILASPSKKDIVTHICYDDFGRQDTDYLPYLDTSVNIASYRSSADVNTNSYYISNYPTDINSANPNPFSQKQFEASPLSRVLKQAAPGNDWKLGSSHEIKLDYQTNTANEVKLFNVSLSFANNIYTPTLSLSTLNSGYYEASQLYKTITKDENWSSGKNNTTEEFKDKEGRVVLKKTYSNYDLNKDGDTADAGEQEIAHDTYYIYDDYGNLTYVLPPKMNATTASITVINSQLNDLGYQYKYDDKNRLVERKLPGKGLISDWEYIVYDKLDRPILTQDANLRVLNKWIFTKYDAFNRPVYTGEYVNAVQTTRTTVQTLANSSSIFFENKQSTTQNINGTSINYSNNTFPNMGIDLFTINYYDDYLNIDLDGGTTVSSYGTIPITNAKGLNTCAKVRILGTTNWTTSVNYYDAKGRPIYNYSKNNYLLATNTLKTLLDFSGKVLETTSTQKKENNPLITLVDTYSYDHVGRLLMQKQTINNQAQEVIVSNTYDNLGQLVNKGVGGKTTQSRLQNIAYNYNIRGWLKNINNVNNLSSSLFAFQINYNTPTTGTPLYNGNISQTLWKTANTDNSLKIYTYSYDALNRLTKATDNSILNPGRYNEGLSYDKNGNIMSILRAGNTNVGATTFGIMDNLTYTYDTGNKLTKVEDTGSTEGFKNGSNTATEYTYDSNGNMKTDANKGITAISYNYLNLPIKVTLGSNFIDYVYDANGVKQRKTISTGGVTDYAGSFIYENNTLKQFNQPEGYVVYNTGIYNYIYQYKDHLGNIRLSYQDKDNNGAVNISEIVQESNYYPFGLTHKGYNNAIIGIDNKYKYNGKELQDELGLGVYDYGARNYDPSIGRWFNIDPLSELADDLTPYHYANNNPIIYIDPDGLSAEKPYDRFETIYKDTKGNVLLDTDDGSDDIVVVPDAKLKDFKELIKYTDPNLYNSKAWNDHFKSEFIGFDNPDEMNSLLDRFTTQWSRQNAINYLQNPTLANAMKMSYSEALSQWTDPQQILAAASVLAFRPANGVIYLREDLTGSLKPYVGQAKNEARYLARQAEHARAHPDSHFKFTVIDKGSANGSFPTSLDIKEQKALNKLGGPTNKSNPKGGASNKKNVIRQ